MQCTQCGIWELGRGDLACSWCGESYLRYTASLEPQELSTEDYPPPITLRIRNDSPLGAITLQTIQPGQNWVRLLPGQPLPQTLQPGLEHKLYLDVDTFAAGSEQEAAITVTVLFAPEVGTATLRLQPPTPATH